MLKHAGLDISDTDTLQPRGLESFVCKESDFRHARTELPKALGDDEKRAWTSWLQRRDTEAVLTLVETLCKDVRSRALHEQMSALETAVNETKDLEPGKWKVGLKAEAGLPAIYSLANQKLLNADYASKLKAKTQRLMQAHGCGRNRKS